MGTWASPRGQNPAKCLPTIPIERRPDVHWTCGNTLDQETVTWIAPIPTKTFGNSRLGSSCGRSNRSQDPIKDPLTLVALLTASVCIAVGSRKIPVGRRVGVWISVTSLSRVCSADFRVGYGIPLRVCGEHFWRKQLQARTARVI